MTHDDIARHCLRQIRGCATDEQYCEALSLVTAALDRAEAADTIDRLTHELSEARAALEKTEDGRKKQYGEFLAEMQQTGRERKAKEGWQERAEAAEAACRSHAEAIGVLREALKRIRAASNVLPSDNPDTHVGWLNGIHATADKALAASVPQEVAAQVERERRAEREVVRAAKEWAKTYNWASACDCAACKLSKALAALPASPPAQAASPSAQD